MKDYGGTEEFENLHNLFAAILAKGIGRQLKQELYREYLSQKEDLAVVRVKIDMPDSIRHRLARKRVLTCEYDELSYYYLTESSQRFPRMICAKQGGGCSRADALQRRQRSFAQIRPERL